MVACGELGLKILMVNQKVKKSAASLNNGESADVVDQPHGVSTGTPESEQTPFPQELPAAALQADESAVSPEPTESQSGIPNEGEDEQYFEL